MTFATFIVCIGIGILFSWSISIVTWLFTWPLQPKKPIERNWRGIPK